MKLIVLLFIGTLFSLNTLGQNTQLTPELKAKIKLSVEKEIPKLKLRLEKENTNPSVIEFIIDTFRIERCIEKYTNLNAADYANRDALYDIAKLYDSIMNKYYKKLLAVLKGDDKKALSQAQKNWLSFRNSETNLVETISKENYSGGGTMQQLTEASIYFDLIKNRAIQIFNHFARATQAY